MNFITKLSGVCAALIVCASSAAAVTVKVDTTVADDFRSPLTGTGIAAGDAITISFDFDAAQSPVGTDPTGGYFAPGNGVANTSGFTQNANSYTFIRPFGDIDRVDGAYFAYTNANVAIPGLGQSYGFGSGFLRANVLDIDTSLAPSAPEYSLELEISTDLFSGLMIWDADTPFALDPSSLIANLSSTPDFMNFYFRADTVALGVEPNPFAQFPNLASISTIGGSFQATGSSKPALPPVAAVPIPAPFLMLGMAMAGLIGFGRLRRA